MCVLYIYCTCVCILTKEMCWSTHRHAVAALPSSRTLSTFTPPARRCCTNMWMSVEGTTSKRGMPLIIAVCEWMTVGAERSDASIAVPFSDSVVVVIRVLDGGAVCC